MYEYKATCINVVDGDTLDVTIDLGFRITIEQRIRLYGINTPERGQPGWAEATAMLKAMVTPVGDAWELFARTVKPHDKYGRWLASLRSTTCSDIAQAMIDAGHGVAYFGGAKPPP